ncbi:hypothetical protein [Methylocapsa sp. S129]|uniref:hypothetical protein n=1 Tax=Methylocapsa sp. S129 TaxID=1641869 RepID=UPI00131B7CF6|nr:hypothetical protein [Methylocapsa sp. S129]
MTVRDVTAWRGPRANLLDDTSETIGAGTIRRNGIVAQRRVNSSGFNSYQNRFNNDAAHSLSGMFADVTSPVLRRLLPRENDRETMTLKMTDCGGDAGAHLAVRAPRVASGIG